jgi:hypothetical protein
VIKGDDSFAQRLREMGFGEAALVTKISGTPPASARSTAPNRAQSRRRDVNPG